MDTIEIYRKSTMIAEKFKEGVEKELSCLQREIEPFKQWQEYYKGAGLHGQASLCEQKAKNLRRKILLIKKGVPYPKVSNDQMEVLNSVFNRCVPAEEFSFQSMPPEVVAAYLEAKEYKEVGIFDSIEVAYYDDDPIMFGKSICKSTGNELRRLIARWGDGLKPWEWFENHFVNEYRVLVPSLRIITALIIASVILLAAYFMLPILDIIRPFLSTIGVLCLAVSAGALIMRVRNKKYNSHLLKSIPSPFTA